MKKKINCTFPQEIIGEPLLYNLSRDFDVVPNIRGASVTDDSGFLALELDGEEQAIELAVTYLRERGVTVEIGASRGASAG